MPPTLCNARISKGILQRGELANFRQKLCKQNLDSDKEQQQLHNERNCTKQDIQKLLLPSSPKPIGNNDCSVSLTPNTFDNSYKIYSFAEIAELLNYITRITFPHKSAEKYTRKDSYLMN